MSIGVALNPIIKDFPTHPGLPQWAISAFTIGTALFMLPSGKLGDRFGRKLMLLWGVVIFTLTSLAAGFAVNIYMLIAARAIQGISGAMITTSCIALVTYLSEKKQRANTLGKLVMTTGAGIALGPLLGGFLVDAFSWRAIFFINIPVGVLSFILILVAIRKLQEVKTPNRFDWFGLVVGGIAVVGITLFLSMSTWLPTWLTIVGLVASLIVLAIFIWGESKLKSPMLTPRLFGSLSFSLANFCGFISYLIIFGWLFAFSVYLPQVYHYSPMETGLALFPFSITFSLCAAKIGSLVNRFGIRAVLTSSLFLACVANAILIITNQSLPYWVLGVSFAFLGLATAGINAGAMGYAMLDIEPQDTGMASGVVMTLRFLAGGIGVALISNIAQGVSHASFQGLVTKLHLPQTQTFNLLLEKILVGLKPITSLQHVYSERAANIISFAVKEALSVAVNSTSATLAGVAFISTAIFILSNKFGFRSEDNVSQIQQGGCRFTFKNIIALSAVSLMFFIVNLDMSATSYALPVLQKSLSIADGHLWWWLTAFSVAFAAILPLSGYLTDRFGIRKIFLIGISLFFISILVNLFTWNLVVNLIFRAILGVGAGLCWPAIQSLIIKEFPSVRIRLAMGLLIGLGAGIGMSLGPYLASGFNDEMNIKIFYICICVISFIIAGLAYSSLPKANKNNFSDGNIYSHFILFLGAGCISFALIYTQIIGFNAMQVLYWLVGGILLFIIAAGVYIVKKTTNSVLLIWNNGFYLAALGARAVALYSYVAVFFLLNLFFQHVLHYSSIHAMLLFLMLTGPVIFTAIISSSIKSLSCLQWLVIGLICITVGLVWISVFHLIEVDFWRVYLPLLLMGCGLGIVLTNSNIVALKAITPKSTGIAAGWLYFVSLIALSLGAGLSVLIARIGAKFIVMQEFLRQGISLNLQQQQGLAHAIDKLQLTRYLIKTFPHDISSLIVPKVAHVFERSFAYSALLAGAFCVCVIAFILIVYMAYHAQGDEKIKLERYGFI